MDFPIHGVKFVYYYCYSSKTGKESKSPGYETVIRALCYRLAWNGDGSLAKPATDLYDRVKLDPDGTPNVREWETLLKSLIESSPTPIVLVIDALDECETRNDYQKLLIFLGGLETQTRLHCLISSQSHIAVKDYFSCFVQLFDVVQPEAEEDMTRFIEDQIEAKTKDPRWAKSKFCTWHPTLNEVRQCANTQKQPLMVFFAKG